jgi:hypothetical protein
MWLQYAKKRLIQIDPSKYTDVPPGMSMEEYIKNQPELSPILQRQYEIGRSALGPDLSEDDAFEDAVDNLSGLRSGEYDASDFYSYIITEEGVESLEEASKNPEKILGRLMMYKMDDPDDTPGATGALKNLSKTMGTPASEDYLYLEDFSIDPKHISAGGKNMWNVIKSITDAMQKSGLPLVAQCRESTSWKFLTSPLVQRWMQRNGYVWALLM